MRRITKLAGGDVWKWLPNERVYRHVATGRTIGSPDVLRMFRGYQARAAVEVNTLAGQLASQSISLNQWETAMREVLKRGYSDAYLLGRGGRNAMTFVDWGSVGGQLSNQYRYLRGFREAVAAGNMTEAQIAYRSRLYVASMTQSIERARTRAVGVPMLPAYPGDGQTVCGTNCKCDWLIEDMGDEWHCTWNLNPAEHCPDCIENSQKWNPLIIPKTGSEISEEELDFSIVDVAEEII